MHFVFLLIFYCFLNSFLYGQEEQKQNSPYSQTSLQPLSQEGSQKEQTKNPSKLAQTKNVDQAGGKNQEKSSAQGAQTKNGEGKDQGEKLPDKGKKKEKKVPTHQLTATVAFLSDYRSRGISQTFRRPAVQGELKYTHKSGFYFKSWGSNVDGTTNIYNNASMEWDLYVGMAHRLFRTKAKYDIGFLYYYYPGGKAPIPANTRYNTLEYYISVNYKGFEIKLSQGLTDFFGVNSDNPPMNWDKGHPIPPNGPTYGSAYLEANLDVSLCPKWKISFHLGYQNVVNYSQLNYLDWLINLTRQFKWFEVTLAYVDTNARKAFYDVPDHAFKPKRINLGGPGVILGVDRSF